MEHAQQFKLFQKPAQQFKTASKISTFSIIETYDSDSSFKPVHCILIIRWTIHAKVEETPVKIKYGQRMAHASKTLCCSKKH